MDSTSNKEYSLFHGIHTSTGWDCHQGLKNYVNGDYLYKPDDSPIGSKHGAIS